MDVDVVNADSGQVLGVVDGRDSAAVVGWLAARFQAWRDRVQVVAIDPSAAFRKAIVDALPHAQISVDPFHLVQLGQPDGDPGAAAAGPTPRAAPLPHP